MRRPAMLTTLSLLASLLSPVAEAGDIRRRDGIHRVSKTHITVVDRLARRDVTACPVNHNLCPATLSGGCCPTAYDCATDSCYATTSAQQTCQGNVGYFQCAMEYEGMPQLTAPSRDIPADEALSRRLLSRRYHLPERRTLRAARRLHSSSGMPDKLLPMPVISQLWMLPHRHGLRCQRLLLDSTVDICHHPNFDDNKLGRCGHDHD